MDRQAPGLERDPRADCGVLRRSYAGLTGCILACQGSRLTEADASALDMPSDCCYFVVKAAAADAAPALNYFSSILHRSAVFTQNLGQTRYKLVFALSKAADRLNQIRIFQFCNEIPCGSNRILCNRTLACVQPVNRNIFALNRNPSPQCWLQVGQNHSDTADPE